MNIEAGDHAIETPWNHTYDWDGNFSLEVTAILVYPQQKSTLI